MNSKWTQYLKKRHPNRCISQKPKVQMRALENLAQSMPWKPNFAKHVISRKVLEISTPTLTMTLTLTFKVKVKAKFCCNIFVGKLCLAAEESLTLHMDSCYNLVFFDFKRVWICEAFGLLIPGTRRAHIYKVPAPGLRPEYTPGWWKKWLNTRHL